ncbi:MAG: hypothetical protein WCK57_02200 [Verrucomicrobiae bacterium]
MTRPFLNCWIIVCIAHIFARAAAAETAPLTASLLENDVLRLRVQHLTSNFSKEFLAVQPTNKLDGIVLDLRSADGDKNAAATASGLFAGKKLPLVILVNGQTCGSAMTLAMDLRMAGAGVLVGGTNFSGSTKPDITVAVASADEIRFLADPFFIPAVPKTNLPVGTNEFARFVDHTSEADLVRKRVKDGEDDDTSTPRVEPSTPVVRDPALVRALDLFKALAALQPARG